MILKSSWQENKREPILPISKTSRCPMNSPKIILVIFAAFALSTTIYAQPETRHPGIVLYEQGKYKEAVDSLKSAVSKDANKTNAAMWSYL